MQLLTFFAGGHEYALSILDVREIAEYRPLTPVPSTPPWLRGVMNLRGTVVPVIDLASKLDMPPIDVTRTTCLLIVDVEIKGEKTILAVMVGGVSSVVDLAETAVQPVPSFGPSVDVDCLQGLARVDDKLVLLLDIRKVVETGGVLAAASMLEAVSAVAS